MPSDFYLIIILSLLLLLLVVFLLLRAYEGIVETTLLERFAGNPVIAPGNGEHWERNGTFNPGALVDDEGNVHLIYRAIGDDGVSRLGYAVSKDGINFDLKLPYPVFSLFSPRKNPSNHYRYDPVRYPSGGSWGGCEDPRLVELDGKVHLSFNAFDGWDYIRIALATIDRRDFFANRWKWSKPLLLSPRGQIHKNWVIFPERIGGKIAILHSISPEIQIDFVDDLGELASGKREIASSYGQREPRDGWDVWLRGAGPPPVKTDRGWLVLYHAMPKEKNCYQLGALLLDLNDPRKVTHRSSRAILNAEHWYEHDSKPGVVYACGAVVKDENLFVYYGGGDKHVCVATTPLNTLLDSLEAV